MKEWIKSFDGLRFFFILFLMFHHFDSFSDLGVNGWNEIMSWLKEGFVSVNFFFLLSGFVVQYAYKDRLLNKKTGSIEFLFNRLAHLYPTSNILIVFCRGNSNIFKESVVRGNTVIRFPSPFICTSKLDTYSASRFGF